MGGSKLLVGSHTHASRDGNVLNQACVSEVQMSTGLEQGSDPEGVQREANKLFPLASFSPSRRVDDL